MFRILGVPGAGDLSLAPGNGFVDPGSGEHVTIQQDGNLLAHVAGRQVRKFLSPFAIEFQGNHRLAGLVHTGFGILQILTGQDGLPLHILEFQQSRTAQHGNGFFRILDPGQFDDDPIPALPLDDRFRQAQFVDPAFDDPDRTVQGVVVHLCLRRILGLQHYMGTPLQIQALFHRTCQRLDEYGKRNHDGQN